MLALLYFISPVLLALETQESRAHAGENDAATTAETRGDRHVAIRGVAPDTCGKTFG